MSGAVFLAFLTTLGAGNEKSEFWAIEPGELVWTLVPRTQHFGCDFPPDCESYYWGSYFLGVLQV